MINTKKILKTAMLTVSALALNGGAASTVDAAGMEKCYGVSAVHANHCGYKAATGIQSCRGTSGVACEWAAWILTPTCEDLGGITDKKEAENKTELQNAACQLIKEDASLLQSSEEGTEEVVVVEGE